MSNESLTSTSFLILALVGREGAGPHDIARLLRRSGRLFWHAAASKYYSEPKRLEQLGYLTSTREPGRTNPRTHYTLTKKGLGALREYLAQPARYPRTQSEPALRLLAADLTDNRKTIESLRGLLDELEELDDELSEIEQAGDQITHRARYLRLSNGLPRRLIAAHREWAKEVIVTLENDPETAHGKDD